MATRRDGFKRCRGCGKQMNPVEVQVAGKYGLCGSCVRKAHKRAVEGR